MNFTSDLVLVKIIDKVHIYGNTERGKRWLKDNFGNPHVISSAYLEDIILTLNEYEITYEESYRIPDLP